MIGITEVSAVTIAVAAIAAVGGVIGAWFSSRAAKSTKTENGHRLGELLEDTARRVERIEGFLEGLTSRKEER